MPTAALMILAGLPAGPSLLRELRFLGRVDVFGEELKGPDTCRVSATVDVSGLVTGAMS